MVRAVDGPRRELRRLVSCGCGGLSGACWSAANLFTNLFGVDSSRHHRRACPPRVCGGAALLDVMGDLVHAVALTAAASGAAPVRVDHVVELALCVWPSTTLDVHQHREHLQQQASSVPPDPLDGGR
jgi:hypothetical protein